MWIRSQDKKELIDVAGKRLFLMEHKTTIRIYVDPMTSIEDVSIRIGSYKTGLRAIEVLDDIQLEIMNYNPDNNVYIMMAE